MPAKYIFVTGGVVSSIGKGISVASIGRILKSRGLSVSVIKLDPYLNVDPGTMSPYQHGEVFVTVDGGETDLDLGHYERFIDVELTRSSNLTAGEVYLELISKERRGDFLGFDVDYLVAGEDLAPRWDLPLDDLRLLHGKAPLGHGNGLQVAAHERYSVSSRAAASMLAAVGI